MKKTLLLIITVALSLNAFSQEERKYIRQGVKDWENNKFDNAEVDFRKAGELAPESEIARFNTGTALYGQQKYKESYEQFEALAKEAENPATAAAIWHNAGNSLLQQKEYARSIEAYKNSLRLNPGDQDTRYNLAYAQKKLLEQQQQQQQQKDQDKKDNKDDKNKQDQKQQNDKQDQNKDDQKKQNDKQEQQQKQDQNKDDQKQQNDKQEQQQGKNSEQAQAIPKEEAERLLNAILNKEKDVKEKVDKAKAQAAKIKTEKDW
ncbi:MAG: tetratricopeptide repeat protein [Bacteroidota bacterium]